MTATKFTLSDADQSGTQTDLPLIVVVLPTYNEADNLPAIVAALLALSLPNLKVVVVDDASPDGTGAIADRLVSHNPGCIRVIHREAPRGLGRAYQAGCRLALEMGAQFIIQMDADFSHNPDDVLRLLDAVSDADVVIGSRYVEGGALDREWNWWRRFLSWWANTVWTQTFLHVSVQDATSGFKCWRRAALEGINLDRIKSNGYVFQVETVYVAEQLGYRIIEIPIFFEDRRLGTSKMTFGVKLEAAWRVLQIRARHRRAGRNAPAVPPSSYANQPHTENS